MSTHDGTRRSRAVAALLLGLCVCAQSAQGAVRDEARRMHDRIAGVPPAEIVLDAMESALAVGDVRGAAYLAMEDPAFYGVTLKNLFTPWTNRDRTAFAPLNDYTATAIGIVRDDLPFSEMLSMDVLYVGADDLPGVPPYAMTDNAHYEALERADFDLSSEAVLVRSTQSARTDLPFEAIAGVLSTRAAAEAFFVAGTNRAMLRFTLMSHLCRDLEQVFDTTRPSDRIRQDVSRSPGGDSRVFLANCIGCHSGMDPLAQAFAYYDYDELSARIMYTPGGVQPKYFNNDDTFPFGYETPDDGWVNRWREGRNGNLGWDDSLPGSGRGAADFGRELGRSRAFAQCHVEQVFELVCLRTPENEADRNAVETITTEFSSTGYQLKQVFADTAGHCRAD